MNKQLLDLRLLSDAVQVVKSAQSQEKAMVDILGLVCAWADWPVAYAFRIFDTDDGNRICDTSPVWHVGENASHDFTDLQEILIKTQFREVETIIGRVLAKGSTVWVSNVAVDPAIDDVSREAMTGIRGACAVPVKRDNQVVAVMEFLACEQLMPDQRMTLILESVADTLGLVFRIKSS